MNDTSIRIKLEFRTVRVRDEDNSSEEDFVEADDVNFVYVTEDCV